MIQFDFILIDGWPPLAWAAKCSKTGSVITVYHGKQVETRNEWFCEAVWDNEFESGDFDKTDLVFGSGCRGRGNNAIFVSSGTTVDRLQSISSPDGVWVSNSLTCLLTVT